jgi:acetyl-CoA carboxylase biotin carboxyl carrier protein
MDLNYLRKILKIFDQSSLSDLSIEEDGIKISLSRKYQATNNFPVVGHSLSSSIPVQQQNLPVQSSVTIEEAKPTETTETTATQYHKIISPIVGTFYRAASPESENFVEVGSHVVPGQTLCIIEAMKVMNEIESDVAGTVVEILPENGKPVEYNQTLMLIKPD